jgi:hypothetical protein
MARPVSNVTIAVDTFGSWITKTNEIAFVLSVNTMTTSTNSSGAITTGNGHVNGNFSANVLAAQSGLRGGNVATAATLAIISNVNMTGTFANVTGTLQGAKTDIGNTVITGTANVTGNVLISGTFVNVTGTLQGTKTDIGNTVITGTANVTGNVLISGTFVNVTGTLQGTKTNIGNTVITGTANVTGNVLISGTFVNVTGTLQGTKTDIGNTLITGTANVTGNVSITGGIVANGSIGTSGQILASNSSGIYWTAALTTDQTATYVWSNTHTFTKAVNVTGTLQGTKTDIGNTVITGTANVTGNVLASGTFVNVTGTLQGAKTDIGNTVITGTANVTGNLLVSGTFVNVTGTLQGTKTNIGNTVITGTANVTGNVLLSGTFANITGTFQSGTTAHGNTTITGTLTTSGNTTIGNATVNAIYADTTNMVVTINTNSTDSGSALSVGGRIYTSGGIKFGDGTTQTTAPTNVNPDGSVNTIRQGNSTVVVSDSGSLGTITLNTTDSANTSKTIMTVNSTAVILNTPTTTANATVTLNFTTFGSIVGKQFSVAAVTPTLIDSFLTTDLRSADYKITASRTGSPNKYMATNLNLVHDGSGVYSTQYGTIFSSNEIVLFTANVDATTVRVYAVSDNTTSTTLKFFRHGLT